MVVLTCFRLVRVHGLGEVQADAVAGMLHGPVQDSAVFSPQITTRRNLGHQIVRAGLFLATPSVRRQPGCSGRWRCESPPAIMRGAAAKTGGPAEAVFQKRLIHDLRPGVHVRLGVHEEA
eukprot:8845431-Pyramimonas_sp.AAC.1